VIALFQNTVPLEPFFENKQAQFDAAKIGWLGTPTTETALHMFWHGSKIRRFGRAAAGVRGRRGRAASTPAFYGRVFNQIFNFKARFITGYPGQNEILLRSERRGRSDGVTVLVEPEDRATRLVQGGQNPLPVPVRLGPAS
jgi:hypothetical protein